MNTNYEIFTPNRIGVPVMSTDVSASTVFELGEPVQTLGGLNGFLTEVSDTGLEGVLDIGSTQVYQAPVLMSASNFEVGAPLYFDPSTGQLTTTAGSLTVFGKLARASYTDVFPIIGTGSTVVAAVSVTN